MEANTTTTHLDMNAALNDNNTGILVVFTDSNEYDNEDWLIAVKKELQRIGFSEVATNELEFRKNNPMRESIDDTTWGVEMDFSEQFYKEILTHEHFEFGTNMCR